MLERFLPEQPVRQALSLHALAQLAQSRVAADFEAAMRKTLDLTW